MSDSSPLPYPDNPGQTHWDGCMRKASALLEFQAVRDEEKTRP
jgi:hypothetical protein